VQTWVPPVFVMNIRAWFFLIYWFGIQLFMGVGSLGTGGDSGGVAVWAHVGGFVAGLLLIKPFENRRLVYAKTHDIVLPPQEVARDEWKL
jgi:membrane associated rhomboid family serine protease